MSNVTNIAERVPYDPHAVPELRVIIGGEAYDTSTARVLHHDHWANDDMGVAGGSVLQITGGGRYFVADYNDSGDEDSLSLRPVTFKDAVVWAEQHCNWKVEDIFGRMPDAGLGTPYEPHT